MDHREETTRHVRVHIDQEVDYWCAKFACSEADLRRAVGHVGTLAVEVKDYLSSARSARSGTQQPLTRY